MALVHRLLLLHQSCFNCTCLTPPVPPPPGHHLLLPTSMTVMASTLGVFFLLGIVCTLVRLYYLNRIESRSILFGTQDDFTDEERGPAVDHPIWRINFVGLQQSVIDSITVCKYRSGEGLIDGTECSVCLSEFEEDESVRLLPKCSHAFHLPCIDTWLRSHKNCPLCRAPVVGNTTQMSHAGPRVPDVETQIEGSETDSELDHHNPVDDDGSATETIVGFDSAIPIDDEIERNSKSCDSRTLSDLADNRRLVGVESMRRSVSMDSNSASMIYLMGPNAGKRNENRDAKLGQLKRQSFKNNGDNKRGDGRGSSSLLELMRSASSGRVSMMRRCNSGSSRNCRSQDSILPL